MGRASHQKDQNSTDYCWTDQIFNHLSLYLPSEIHIVAHMADLSWTFPSYYSITCKVGMDELKFSRFNSDRLNFQKWRHPPSHRKIFSSNFSLWVPHTCFSRKMVAVLLSFFLLPSPPCLSHCLMGKFSRPHPSGNRFSCNSTWYFKGARLL